jgi:hypothetical protein
MSTTFSPFCLISNCEVLMKICFQLQLLCPQQTFGQFLVDLLKSWALCDRGWNSRVGLKAKNDSGERNRQVLNVCLFWLLALAVLHPVGEAFFKELSSLSRLCDLYLRKFSDRTRPRWWLSMCDLCTSAA